MTDRKYRIIILGAGFSRPAGLPLADELWQKILKQCKNLWGRASMLNDDLDAYIGYRRDCDGIELTRDTVNFEEFLGYLDVEHYLGLRGKNTWSIDGNEGQVVVKTLIGNILTQYMPAVDKIPELYLKFARRLRPGDYILTFNYDILLERSLDALEIPYRLFPDRFVSVSRYSGIIDSRKEEVIILKLHGSIDWFDKKRYLNRLQNYKEQGAQEPPEDIVFNSKEKWSISKLVDGPRPDNDPLTDIYRVAEIEDLYKKQLLFLATPWMLSPSTNKIVYASPLYDFWNGLGVSGQNNFGMAIIGYSLPFHDVYAKQTIYSLVRNYQEVYWDQYIFRKKKSPLVLVDFQPSQERFKSFRDNYRFIDFNKAELYMDGFNIDVIDKIFS
ncbi:MAG: hypothetical protein AB1641_06745 [Thermodesulfobacteriota bacterium]